MIDIIFFAGLASAAGILSVMAISALRSYKEVKRRRSQPLADSGDLSSISRMMMVTGHV